MIRTPEERQSGDVATEPVEFRMRFRRLLERVALDDEPPREPALGPYLTVSREAESGGAEVARGVGELLGWRVLGRELVQDLAHQLELEPRLLELMDETRIGWFSETLLNLFNSRLVLQGSYVSMLSRSIALAACDGPVVIVGRAANLVLPPEFGLRVRIVAPHGLRVEALADREGLDLRAAGDRLDKVDANRANFVRRHFHTDVADPHNYDLVIDTAQLDIGAAADLICRALELRGLTGETL
jgi:cytidylate kinase